jgi:hypothetical protein
MACLALDAGLTVQRRCASHDSVGCGVRHESCRSSLAAAEESPMRARTLILCTLCALLFVAVRPLAAQEPLPADTKSAVEGTLGNNVLQLRYFMQSPLQQKSSLDLGLLIATERQFVATAALMFDTNLGVPGLEINVGPQGYLAWLNGVGKTQVAAIAGGLNARYEVVPQYHVGVFGHAFYSPGILTFGVADNVYDFAAGADVRITDHITVMAGYRWFKFTLSNQPGDEVQNEVFAGLRWRLD